MTKATMREGAVVTLPTSAAVSAYRRVDLGAGTVAHGAAGAAGIGITEYAVGSGELAAVRLHNGEGTRIATADGAIGLGAQFYGAADGKISATVSGDPIGAALQAATADDDQIEVIIY